MIHSLARLLLPVDDPMRDESGQGDLYFSEALLQLLARHNLKAVCKKLWPAFSKIPVCQFLPATPLDYYEWEAERGINDTTIPPNRKPWDSLIGEAYSTAHSLPKGLVQRPFLTALFCMILPQRCTTPTVRFLADQFDSSWSRGAGKLVPAGGSQ
jgi:hypothetical protein